MARIEIKETSNRIIKKWFSACSVFFKIMIPVSLIIKILEETGLMQYVGYALSPLMQPLGLPGEMGLVWAATMLSNIYGGLLSLSSLQPEGGMTVAQITTLSSLMLFAHTFLIEIPICVKAGCRFIPIFLIRFVSAYLFALLTAQICMRFSLCDSPVSAIHFTETSSSWVGWAIGEVKKYVSIALIVLSLVVLLELLERIGFLRLLEKVLSPVVGFIGISPKVIPITIIGMTLGLAYGGGLIVAESKEKPIDKRDIFLSLAFLSLFHSIIEDHLLMIGIGANAFFVFVLRFVFSVVAMLLIKYLYDNFGKILSHFRKS
ncbi:MAG: nucleoside recognition domain-containing protein [Bacteroidales bacterium]|nr:nucleoside recognition domain-containing protein [Bacteroidales bacterium]